MSLTSHSSHKSRLHLSASNSFNVKKLGFALSTGFPNTGLLPLLQLTGLTCLEVYEVGSAAAAVYDTASQMMPQLKQLRLLGASELADPAVILRYPSLSKLEALDLQVLCHCDMQGPPPYLKRLQLPNKVCMELTMQEAAVTYHCNSAAIAGPAMTICGLVQSHRHAWCSIIRS
jgi:hypothetical protein